MWPNPQFLQFPTDLVRFTEEILNEKLHFLRCVDLLKNEMQWNYDNQWTTDLKYTAAVTWGLIKTFQWTHFEKVKEPENL